MFFHYRIEICVFTTDSWNKFPGTNTTLIKLLFHVLPLIWRTQTCTFLAFWRKVFFSIHHDENCCLPERFELMFILGSLCSLAYKHYHYDIRIMKAARFRNYHHFMILNDTCFDFGWMIRMIRFQILVKASTTKWANCSSLSHSKDLRKTVAPKNMCRFLKMFQSDQSYNLKWSLEKNGVSWWKSMREHTVSICWFFCVILFPSIWMNKKTPPN